MCAMVTAGRIRAAIKTNADRPSYIDRLYTVIYGNAEVDWSRSHSQFRVLLGSHLALTVGTPAEGARPIKNANACFPDDIPEFDRLEVACIDTNVELAGKRLELSMAVAV